MVYVLINSKTRQIRTDAYTGCLLIFDNELDAKKHLEKVKPKSDKYNTDILARVMTFKGQK